MTKATFTISGDIEEFDHMDNLYRSMKRAGEKLLKNWIINVKAEYSENEEESKK